MKKIKYVFVIILVIFSIILLDTIQSKIFNNSPIIHIRKYYYNNKINFIDKGILVYHYEYINGNSKTIFVWQDTLY